MPTVNIDDVKALTGTGLSDSLIQMQIDLLIGRVGSALDVAYSETESNAIALYAASAMTDISDPSSKIKTERAANGASTTYQDKTFSLSSFKSNQFGVLAMSYDSKNILDALFPRTFGIGVSGQKAGVPL